MRNNAGYDNSIIRDRERTFNDISETQEWELTEPLDRSD